MEPAGQVVRLQFRWNEVLLLRKGNKIQWEILCLVVNGRGSLEEIYYIPLFWILKVGRPTHRTLSLESQNEVYFGSWQQITEVHQASS